MTFTFYSGLIFYIFSFGSIFADESTADNPWYKVKLTVKCPVEESGTLCKHGSFTFFKTRDEQLGDKGPLFRHMSWQVRPLTYAIDDFLKQDLSTLTPICKSKGNFPGFPLVRLEFEFLDSSIVRVSDETPSTGLCYLGDANLSERLIADLWRLAGTSVGPIPRP